MKITVAISALVCSLACSLLVSGCTWVKPVEEAKDIALVKPELAQHCKKISAVTVKVKDSVGFVNRRESKVQDELITLAKNEAATLGADIIVAETKEEEGRQRFGAYACDK